MKFVLELNCDNDAFGAAPHAEVGRILSRLGEHITAFAPMGGLVRDINGNTVGDYYFADAANKS